MVYSYTLVIVPFAYLDGKYISGGSVDKDECITEWFCPKTRMWTY